MGRIHFVYYEFFWPIFIINKVFICFSFFFYLTSAPSKADSFEDSYLAKLKKSREELGSTFVSKDTRQTDSNFSKKEKKYLNLYPFKAYEPATLQAFEGVEDPLIDFYRAAFKKVEDSNKAANKDSPPLAVFIDPQLIADFAEMGSLPKDTPIKSLDDIFNPLIKKYLGPTAPQGLENLNPQQMANFRTRVVDELASRIRAKDNLQNAIGAIVSPSTFKGLTEQKNEQTQSSPVLQALLDAAKEVDNEACKDDYLKSYHTRRFFNSSAGKFRVQAQSTIQCHSSQNHDANAYMRMGGINAPRYDFCQPTNKDKSIEDGAMLSARQKEATLDLLQCPYVIDREAGLNKFFGASTINKTLGIKHSNIEGTKINTNGFFDINQMLSVWNDVYKSENWTPEKLKAALKDSIKKDLEVKHELVETAKLDVKKPIDPIEALTGAHSGQARKSSEALADSADTFENLTKKTSEHVIKSEYDKAAKSDPFKNHGGAYQKSEMYSQLTPPQLEYLQLCIQEEIDKSLRAVAQKGSATDEDFALQAKIIEVCSSKAVNGIERMLPTAKTHALEILNLEMNMRKAALTKLKAFDGDKWQEKATDFEKGLNLIENHARDIASKEGKKPDDGTISQEDLLKAYKPDILKKFGIEFSAYPYRKPDFSHMKLKEMERLLKDPPGGADLKNPDEALQGRIALSALLGDMNYDPKNENIYIKDMRRFIKDINFFQNDIYKPENEALLKEFKSGNTWMPPPLLVGDTVFNITHMKLNPDTKKTEMSYSAMSQSQFNSKLENAAKVLSEKLSGKNGDGGLLAELQKLAGDKQHWTGAFKKLAAQYEGTRKAYGIPTLLTPFMTLPIVALGFTDRADASVRKTMDEIPETAAFKNKMTEIENLIRSFENDLKMEYGFDRHYKIDLGRPAVIDPKTNAVTKAAVIKPFIAHHEELYGKNTPGYKNSALAQFHQASAQIMNPMRGYSDSGGHYQEGMLSKIKKYVGDIDTSASQGEVDQMSKFFGNPFYEWEKGEWEFNLNEGIAYQVVASPTVTSGVVGAGSAAFRLGGSALMTSARGAQAMRYLGYGTNFAKQAQQGNRIRTILGEAKYGWDAGGQMGKMIWGLQNGMVLGLPAVGQSFKWAKNKTEYSIWGDEKDKKELEESFKALTDMDSKLFTFINMNTTEKAIETGVTGLAFGAGSQVIKSMYLNGLRGTRAGLLLNSNIPSSVENALLKMPVYNKLLKGAMNVDEVTGLVRRHIQYGDLAANLTVSGITSGAGLDKKALFYLKKALGKKDDSDELIKAIAKLEEEVKTNNSPKDKATLASYKMELDKINEERRGLIERVMNFDDSLKVRDDYIAALNDQIKEYEDVLKQGINPLAKLELSKKRTELTQAQQSRKDAVDEGPSSFGFWTTELGFDLAFAPMPTEFLQDMTKFSKKSYESGVRNSVFGNATAVKKANGKIHVEFSDLDYRRMEVEQRHLFWKHKCEGLLETPLEVVNDSLFGLRKNPNKIRTPGTVTLKLKEAAKKPEVIAKLQKRFGSSVQTFQNANGEIIFSVPEAQLQKFGSTAGAVNRQLNSYTYTPPLKEVGRSASGNRIFEITNESEFTQDMLTKWALRLKADMSKTSRQFFFPSSGAYLAPKGRTGI